MENPVFKTTPFNYFDYPHTRNPMLALSLYKDYLKDPTVNWKVSKFLEYQDGIIEDSSQLPKGTLELVSGMLNNVRRAVNKIYAKQENNVSKRVMVNGFS